MGRLCVLVQPFGPPMHLIVTYQSGARHVLPRFRVVSKGCLCRDEYRFCVDGISQFFFYEIFCVGWHGNWSAFHICIAFNGAKAFNSDISKWDTSRVITLHTSK